MEINTISVVGTPYCNVLCVEENSFFSFLFTRKGTPAVKYVIAKCEMCNVSDTPCFYIPILLLDKNTYYNTTPQKDKALPQKPQFNLLFISVVNHGH